ncbi:MAG: flagellar hook-associated protein FlgK, partial [Deltaproteobacteria bacterium]|nr:flagellar hook-associated protein FlgK [Deltaproteobacteria bacterium]
MSTLGAVFDIAKSALATQRYGLDVTGHNIANVNTPGYSRQSPVLTAKQTESKGELIFGRGVNITQVVRASDQFIENQLMQQKSKMLSSKEMENYMQVLEGVFNENPETSISAMLSDFWNLWHDISNNPSGVSERTALYEHSILLSERFNALDGDLAKLETDLTNSLSTGIDVVNRISNEIAQINEQIPGLEAGNNIVNDLRDKRNIMVCELSEYLDVNTFEQDNGTLTVVAARGCILVHGDSSYDLEMGGANGDRVKWQSSGGTTVDITNYINSGRLGGWLDMREVVVAKYKLDISAVAEAFIWAVNSQHSQGVGLEAFSTVTGTYQASDTNISIDSSG